MTPAERLQQLMNADPRSDAEKARQAGLNRQAWGQYKRGERTPGLELAARILTSLQRKWADLD